MMYPIVYIIIIEYYNRSKERAGFNMRKIIIVSMLSLLMVGCSSNKTETARDKGLMMELVRKYYHCG